MSSKKKMKGVAFDSSPYLVYGGGGGGGDDGKTMMKYQSLMQDYLDLQKDVEASRQGLENAKQKRLTLLAEVRFLRRRHKNLSKSKFLNIAQERGKELVQPHYEKKQRKINAKAPIAKVKEATTLHKLPPVIKAHQKRNMYERQEASLQSVNPNFDPKQHIGKNAARVKPISNIGRTYKAKKATHQVPMPVIDLNQQDRLYYRDGAANRNPISVSNVNQNEIECNVDPALQNRAPVFDLNQIAREEDELRDSCEPLSFIEPKKGLINEEQLSDFKLSICRNVGDGSNRAVKRKISWQDPVALRV